MSGGKRVAKAAAQPARGPATNKRGTSSAARSTEPPPPPPAKADPRSQPGKGKRKENGAGGAAADDAREDALAEARGMAAAVADDDEGINDKPASPPPATKKSDRAMTLELQKEKAERAKLLAETERLRKQLDAYTVRESKRKQSEAAEPAPPAKRAVGSGRRTAPQSAAVSRRRL